MHLRAVRARSCFRRTPPKCRRSSGCVTAPACRSWRAATAPGLSGGALPHPDGVLIVLSRLNRILEVDIPKPARHRRAGRHEPRDHQTASPQSGCYYAPDPSSQIVCSIGGNIAENSGGAHCLKYGFTVHHVLGVEAVLPDGELVHLGGPALDPPGLDLLGVARRIRRHARGRHEGHAAPAAPPGSRADAARGLRLDRRGRRGGVGDHRRAASCRRRSR